MKHVVVADELLSACVRRARALVAREDLAYVTERLPDVGDLPGFQVREALGRVERSLEELGGDGVRERPLGAVAGENAVAPCLLELACLDEVQREQGGRLIGGVSGPPFERRAEPAVQITTPPQGEPPSRRQRSSSATPSTSSARTSSSTSSSNAGPTTDA